MKMIIDVIGTLLAIMAIAAIGVGTGAFVLGWVLGLALLGNM